MNRTNEPEDPPNYPSLGEVTWATPDNIAGNASLPPLCQAQRRRA